MGMLCKASFRILGALLARLMNKYYHCYYLLQLLLIRVLIFIHNLKQFEVWKQGQSEMYSDIKRTFNQKLRLSPDLRRGLRIYSNYFLGVPIKLVLLRLFLKIFELKLCVAVGVFKFSAACYPEFAFSLIPYSGYNCSTFAWENASIRLWC
jgi:hypothetical protein